MPLCIVTVLMFILELYAHYINYCLVQGIGKGEKTLKDFRLISFILFKRILPQRSLAQAHPFAHRSTRKGRTVSGGRLIAPIGYSPRTGAGPRAVLTRRKKRSDDTHRRC